MPPPRFWTGTGGPPSEGYAVARVGSDAGAWDCAAGAPCTWIGTVRTSRYTVLEQFYCRAQRIVVLAEVGTWGTGLAGAVVITTGMGADHIRSCPGGRCTHGDARHNAETDNSETNSLAHTHLSRNEIPRSHYDIPSRDKPAHRRYPWPRKVFRLEHPASISFYSGQSSDFPGGVESGGHIDFTDRGDMGFADLPGDVTGDEAADLVVDAGQQA